MRAALLPVRRASVEDATEIASVHVRAWREAYATLLPRALLDGLDEAERARQWTDAIAGNTAAVFVIEDEEAGVIVGFAAVGPVRMPAAGDDVARDGELYALYVLRGAQGNGAGTALMRTAMQELRATAKTCAWLWVLKSNAKARRFYEIDGWHLDTATRTELMRGVPLEEVRYRRPFPPRGG